MSSYSQQVSRNSMQRRASRTNPRDARHAATREKMQVVNPEKCSQQHVLTAEKKLRFLSSPAMTDLYTAASALLQWSSSNSAHLSFWFISVCDGGLIHGFKRFHIRNVSNSTFKRYGIRCISFLRSKNFYVTFYRKNIYKSQKVWYNYYELLYKGLLCRCRRPTGRCDSKTTAPT